MVATQEQTHKMLYGTGRGGRPGGGGGGGRWGREGGGGGRDTVPIGIHLPRYTEFSVAKMI